MESIDSSYHAVLHLWPNLNITSMDRQYSRLLEHIESELVTTKENPDLFALQSRTEVFSLIRNLKELGPVGRHEAVDAALRIAPPGHSFNDTILRSLDTALRIWLTIDVTTSGLRRPGRLVWTGKQSLKGLVESHFHELENTQSSTSLDGRVQPEVTAASLVANYGYAISWTHNLIEHLDVDWKNKVITVYEHKLFLQNNLRFSNSVIIPDSVLEEAIDTLNLLFPFQDDSTRRFLLKHKKPFYGLGFCNRPRKLDLGEYRYWRSRVADLQLISDGPPIGLQQLRLDKTGSNVMQFATFWVATAVGILAVVSIGIGVAAIIYGAKQYEIGVLQYELAVAQACLDPVAKAALTRFCS